MIIFLFSCGIFDLLFVSFNVLSKQTQAEKQSCFSLYRTKNGDTLILLKAAAPAKII